MESMKFLKYLFVFILLAGLGISIWIYYPEYQLEKMKRQTVEVNNDTNKISYLNYFRESKKTSLYHLALGDSIIRGVGAKQNENLVNQFSNKLGAQIHKKIQFQNEGINGITSSELLKLIQTGRFNEEIKKADIITINVGGNDILRMAKSRDFNSLFQSFDQLQSTFSKNLFNIESKIKTLNPKATIVFLELYNPLSPSDHIYAIADKMLPNWNLKIYQVANQCPSSIVVETTKVMNGERRQNLSPDGIHPNTAGYSAISEQMIYQFKHQYRKESV